MHFLIQGLIAGFIIASPIGPVGILCIRRTLTEGPLIGLLTVLGAATADACYGIVAAVGLTAVSHTLMAHPVPFRISAGLFLFVLGARLLRARPAPLGSSPQARSFASAYISTLLLMLANPFIIVSFLAVFGTLGLHTTGIGDLAAGWLAAGLFFGSAAWWIVFEAASTWLRPRVDHGDLRAINLAAGTLICGFGAWQCVELLRLFGRH